MKVVSYYKYCPDKQEGFGLSLEGQGARRYWENAIGIALPKLLGDAVLVGRKYGYDHTLEHVQTYPTILGHHEIAYCQTFDIPKCRPPEFVYGMIDDVEYNEPQLEQYLEKVRPDVLFTVQDNRPKVHAICAKYGTKCVFLPWFNLRNDSIHHCAFTTDYNPTWRNIRAMSTGAIGPCYSKRTAICEYLKSIRRAYTDILLSTTNDQTSYPLDYQAYINALCRTRYYISCGVLDFEIPSKFFEVCNYGACLVSFDMPMMEACGFIDGETYIKLNSLDEIPEIIDSNRWRTIGPAGQKMVHERHTIQQRAKQILQEYELWKQNH